MDTRIDFTDLLPHMARRTVGFDRLFDAIRQTQPYADKTVGYPPYNVIRHSDNEYSIELAVAGFSEENLQITHDGNLLTVRGNSTVDDSSDTRTYLHNGISNREFSKSWTLADHVEVKNARMVNGFLVINLEHIVPDSLKPRVIAIDSNTKKLK